MVGWWSQLTSLLFLRKPETGLSHCYFSRFAYHGVEVKREQRGRRGVNPCICIITQGAYLRARTLGQKASCVLVLALSFCHFCPQCTMCKRMELDGVTRQALPGSMASVKTSPKSVLQTPALLQAGSSGFEKRGISNGNISVPELGVMVASVQVVICGIHFAGCLVDSSHWLCFCSPYPNTHIHLHFTVGSLVNVCSMSNSLQTWNFINYLRNPG